MNSEERRKYADEYTAINARFSKKYYPGVFRATNDLVSSLIEKIGSDGINAAIAGLTITVMNEKLYDPVSRIYRNVGLFHAKRTYRLLRAEVARKSIGRSEQWIAQIIQYLRDTLLQYSVMKATETLRNKLLKVLQQGVDEGLSEFEMIKLLKESGLAKAQAQRIVRTEINRAANTGNYVSGQSFEYETSKEWIAHKDPRTRGFDPKDKHDHYHMDGKVVDLEEKFTDPKSGESIAYPSAPGASAGMVVNCRCSMALVPKRDGVGRLVRKPNIAMGVPIG